MNIKALKLRDKHSDTRAQAPIIDSDHNEKLIKELDTIRTRTGIQTHLVTFEGVPVASILFKFTVNQCTVYVTRFVNGRRQMFKNTVRGSGFDRSTAALDGCELMYPDSLKTFKIEDGSRRWDNMLFAAGFQVWQTL